MFFSLCLEHFPQPLAWLSPHPVGLALISTNMEFLANTVRINTACLLPKSPFCFRVGLFPVRCSVVLVMAFPIQCNTLVGCHPSASCSQLCIQCLAVSGFGWHLGGNYMDLQALGCPLSITGSQCATTVSRYLLLPEPTFQCGLLVGHPCLESSMVSLWARSIFLDTLQWVGRFYTPFQLAVGTMMRGPESPKQSSLKLAPCD